MSTQTSFAATELKKIFMDETNRTEFTKFLGAKLTITKVDKNAVEIALNKVVGMPMSSFKIQAELEAGQAAELVRRDKLIADVFKAQNEEHVALVEGMPNGTGPERLECMKQKVKIAGMKTKYVDSLKDWLDYIGVIL